MFADTILDAERQHLVRLLLWAGLSILAGTLVFVMLAARRSRSPLLVHFAMQTAGWGVVIGAIAAVGWHGLHLRDLAGAARLERILWLNIGLDIGYVGIGLALAIAGRALARRMSVVGAGTAVVVQGLALLLIDLQFAALVSR